VTVFFLALRLQDKAVQRQAARLFPIAPQVQTEKEKPMTPMQSIHRIFALATFAAIASFAPAHAQDLVSRVNVPFAFDCGSAHFSPGTYTIARARLTIGNVLTLWDGKKTSQFLIGTGDGPRSNSNIASGYVLFHKYGNRYFLAEYHPSYWSTSMELPSSSKERIVARDFALYQPEPGRVLLAVNEANLSR
jgi:hypothetical protein